jgi:hypothetical protein
MIIDTPLPENQYNKTLDVLTLTQANMYLHL